jgi:endonuclease/exonuclease/phosphatase family metal-dependent hydrolase
MATKFRLFTTRFFLFANIVALIFFLLACAGPYLDPGKWWFIAVLGFGFPFLLTTLIIFGISWLFVRKRFALISAIGLLIGIKSISVFFAFHSTEKFRLEKDPGSIRIVSWNVARFVELLKNNNKGSQTRLRMMEQLEAQNADILCLQEFQSSILPTYYNNIYHINKRLKYPFFYFMYDADGDGHYYSSIIFSRFPIVDSGFVRFPRPSNPEVLLFADIKANEDTIRVYTTHLQSLHFKKNEYEMVEGIKRVDDSLLTNSRTIFSKLRTGTVNRRIQADIVAKIMDDSPYPRIICMDMNDIPNSYAYNAVRGDMQDAFLKKGFGIGRTFSAISPTLRIDYIFADERLKVRQFKRVLKPYSDHYMLVTDVSVKKLVP